MIVCLFWTHVFQIKNLIDSIWKTKQRFFFFYMNVDHYLISLTISTKITTFHCNWKDLYDTVHSIKILCFAPTALPWIPYLSHLHVVTPFTSPCTQGISSSVLRLSNKLTALHSLSFTCFSSVYLYVTSTCKSGRMRVPRQIHQPPRLYVPAPHLMIYFQCIFLLLLFKIHP